MTMTFSPLYNSHFTFSFNHHALIQIYQRIHYSTFGVRAAALSAEWKPTDGMKWEEKDFEAEIKKLEKEAESRLDAKIKELEANIEKVGKP